MNVNKLFLRWAAFFGMLILFTSIVPTSAQAAVNITSSTVNSGSSVTVAPGATISANVAVTLTNGTNWRSTSWRIGGSGSYTCVNHTNHDSNGNYNETFNITAPNTNGTYNVSFIAYTNNGCDSSTNDTQTMNNAVVVAAPQVPPIMGNVPNQTATVGISFTLNPAISTYVTPTNGDAILSYAYTGTLPPGLSFNTSTGALSGTPTTAGTYTMGVTASDNDGASNSDSFTITVVPQTPPIMGNVPNQTATVGTAFSLNIGNYVTQTDGDAITGYTLSGTLPAGLSFNTSTGVINGTPTTAASAVTLSVTATDNDGTSNSDSFTIAVVTAPTSANSYRDFTLRKQLYAKGNMKTIGNTVMVLPTNGQNCTTYTNGSYSTNSTSANGDVNLCAYSVDGTQTNATTAELALPENSKVLWAGLYWQGVMINAIDTNMHVNIRRDNSAYTSVSPNVLNYKDEGWDYTAGNGIHYAAFADVSNLFGEGKWNEGNYTVSGIPVVENGNENGLGTYGAWTLIAIYEVPTEKFRSFSVFDGWKQVTDSTDAVIPVSGFYTPNRTLESTAAKVSVFAAEGDLPYTGDQLKTKNYNTNVEVVLETIANNTFNSSVTGGGARTPNPSNNFGIDIQSFDIGNLLKPQQTDMTFTFTSNLDVYWPSMIAFSTELVAPQLCYDYSFKQDGQYFKADNNGSQLPLLTGTISNSPLETSIYLRNNEADIKAQGVSFYSDVNASMFDYKNGTVESSNVNGSAYISRAETMGSCGYDDPSTTPIGCNNGANIRIGLGYGATGYSQNGGGSLGDKEFVYAKFDMNPIGVNGITDVNQSLGLHLNYYIVPKTGATPIPYNYEFGTDISLCPPSSGYQPVWGIFNVVDAAASTVGTLPANNLRTQVSRNPFNVDVAVYQKNATTGKYTDKPTSDMNTTVLVEMIDNDAFHDTNASCANPGSAVSKPIFLRISNTATDMTIPIPTQNTMYHNFAVKNAAFRIWYFDQNQSLINWSATTSDVSHLNLTGISNLYKNSYHTECTTACSTSTTTACFDCIKANYARPLCSRDNFAVRPESYDLRIFDINQTADIIIKDSTKIDLSNKYQYAPMYGASLDRINVASGYDYRYDLNATGHDSNLSAVPGYTRYFKGANTDYNATMIWEPTSTKTGCNDTSSKSLSFYIANGQMVNEEQNQSQVGEYRLNIIDPSWTAVDWNVALTGHHTVSNGFEATKEDCYIGLTNTVPANGKIGCLTSSAHTGGGYTYKDHLLTLQPYKFTIPSTFRYGTVPYDLNTSWVYDGNLTNDVLSESNIIYYSKLSNNADINMSLQLDGSIAAVGYNGTSLSNFVRDCYAKPINLILDHNRTVQTRTAYQSRFFDYNSSGSLIYDSGAINVTGIGATTIQTISDGNFSKDMNGALSSKVRVNFDRNASMVVNPMPVRFYNYSVNCPDCNRSADLNISSAYGAVGMGFDIMHYYGRAQGRDATFVANSANQAGGYARIYFEMYCSNTDTNASSGGVDCDMDKLTSNMAGESPGWYVNIDHNITNDGRSDSDNSLSVGNLKVGTSVVPPAGSVTITPTEIGFERYGVNYNGNNGYPLTKILENYADGWLIYNTTNAGILYNSFSVEFRKKGAWIGEGKSGTATDSDAPIQTNRRIMW